MGGSPIQSWIAASALSTLSEMEVSAGILSQRGDMSSIKLLEVRPQVARFALAMEQKLRENDWKGGWQEMEDWEVFDRIDEEVQELKLAGTETLLGEAADVANFCMFYADNYGTLK